MKNSKHTKGPWRHDGTQVIANNRHLTRISRHLDCHDCEFCKADARLIASAPEMLEALEEIRSRLGSCALEAIGAVGIDILNNAINKAKGE
jgi:hypothetical protein